MGMKQSSSRTARPTRSPLSHSDYDRTNVYSLQWSDDRVSISASGFLKENGIQTEQTIRYSPEWREDIGNDQVPGGVVIDLDQDGEVAQAADDDADVAPDGADT